LQYQNKALANANKQLKITVSELTLEVANKHAEMQQVEASISTLASALVKVSFFCLHFQVNTSLVLISRSTNFAQKPLSALSEILNFVPNSVCKSVK